jgi:hypothetical protein
MRLVVCTDSRGGMMFNKRRTTYDRCVTEDILRDADGGKLLIAPYSEKIFRIALFTDEDEVPKIDPEREDALPYTVSDSPLDDAENGDTVFIEDRDTSAYIGKITEIVIYNWNLTYPYDRQFDIDPTTDGFKLISVNEFPGISHDIITKSVFSRKK